MSDWLRDDSHRPTDKKKFDEEMDRIFGRPKYEDDPEAKPVSMLEKQEQEARRQNKLIAKRDLKVNTVEETSELSNAIKGARSEQMAAVPEIESKGTMINVGPFGK